MAFSGNEIGQPKPSGHPQGIKHSFTAKTEAEVVVVLDDGAAWFIVMKAARMIR